MGQAKQRGTLEDRITQAQNSYQDRLKELSEYGLSTEELHAHFQGDELMVINYLSQIEHILSFHPNVVKVTLLLKDGQLGLDVETSGVERKIGEQERNLIDMLNIIDKALKPKSMAYQISLNNKSKEKIGVMYGSQDDKCFDLPLGQTKEYFCKFLTESLDDIDKAEMDYHSEILAACSNHPFSAGKEQSFIFKKEIRMS